MWALTLEKLWTRRTYIGIKRKETSDLGKTERTIKTAQERLRPSSSYFTPVYANPAKQVAPLPQSEEVTGTFFLYLSFSSMTSVI